jgi:uncharacterized membrane protein YhfC
MLGAMITVAHICAIVMSLLISIGLPVAILLVWRRKTHASLLSALVGAGTFFLFAMVLESLCHRIVLQPKGYIATHAWAYALYASLAAGIFEETGRYLAFRFPLRKKTDRKESVMYGIGHGGLEAILLSGVSLCMLLWMILHPAKADYQGTLQSVAATPAVNYLAGGIERITAIALHIALSVLVFHSMDDWKWYPIAILLHAGVDAIAMLYRLSIIKNIWLLEAIVAIATLLVVLLAKRIYEVKSCS